MITTRLHIWVVVLVMLATSRIVTGDDDLKRLTWCYSPEKSALYPIGTGACSMFCLTELAVADTAWLSIDLFEGGNPRSLVRHIVQPEDGFRQPAVYSVHWWCIRDSLDLPVTGGLYSMVVRATEYPRGEKVIFADSTEVVVTEGKWESLIPDSTDIETRILNGWEIGVDKSLEKTDVLEQFSAIEVIGTKLLTGYASPGADKLVIKLRDTLLSREYDPFRNDARGYACIRDSISSGGYRILREVAPFRGQHSVWPLSSVDREFLMIDCVGHWPVVVDASRFLGKIKARGELR